MGMVAHLVEIDASLAVGRACSHHAGDDNDEGRRKREESL